MNTNVYVLAVVSTLGLLLVAAVVGKMLPPNAATRKEIQKVNCAMLRNEGLAKETRWSEHFGCLVKDGDGWRVW